MRFITTLILNLTLISILQAQTVAEKIAINACGYLDSIDNLKVLQDSIQPSIIAAAVNVMTNGNDDERKLLGTVEGIRGTLKQAFEILPNYCHNVRKLIIEDKKSKFYKRSSNKQANEYFDSGNNYMGKDEYKNAVKAFKSALNLDNNFVYAIDNLAIAYRRQEDYKTAIKYYKKSLEIFPEGDVALLNIAVSYSLVNDDENSIKYYKQLKYLYPNDPEGYFGLAKMLFIKADYEVALDNIFIAHRIYTEKKSDYIKDSEQLMGIIYSKLKELNKTELFDRKAKEYNITIKK
jgi:tetratricopeptide (TPR) repeat protein